MSMKNSIADFCKCISTSQILARGKVAIFSITLVATSGGVADVAIYDGDNTTGEKRIELIAAANSTQHVTFPKGCPFNQAMYVNVGSNVSCVCITWSFREE